MPAKNSLTKDREIIISRIINAPRGRVFEVWTDKKHLERWFGPNGFTTTTKEIAVKPKGVWHFIMHGPDGTDYPNRIIYPEIIQPRLIAYIHDNDKENNQEQFQTIVTFKEINKKTELTLRSIFKTKEQRNLVVEKYGAIEGGKQTLARLDNYMQKMK